MSSQRSTSAGICCGIDVKGTAVSGLVGVVFALLCLGAALAPAASAAPSLLTQFGKGGFFQTGEVTTAKAGQTQIPRGVATDPNTGHVYVADVINSRIDEFTAWGVFVKAFGWGVLDGSAEPQTCTEATGCQAGIEGSGAGQFLSPQGLAVDSAGSVYVVDRPNHRVQKFDSEGRFLRMWGKGVNSGTSGSTEICTNAGPPTDVCGVGGEGTGPGQFGAWPVVGSFIAIDPTDNVYVGDAGRIQRFDAAGAYQGEIALPGELVQSLAVDGDGNLYVAYVVGDSNNNNDKPDVHKLDPSGAPIAPQTFPVPNPRAVAVDVDGDVYVFDKAKTEVLHFDPSAELADKFAEDLEPESSGIATGSACLTGGADIYVSNSNFVNSYVRAYGPAPDRTELCPAPPAPPEILAQFAWEVGTASATLRAKINSRFWADTRYYAQYGTAECLKEGDWEAACVIEKPTPPGTFLGGGVTDAPLTASVQLTGLQPGTSYRYRFVAKSGGDPEAVIGLGGKPGIEGSDATFKTYEPFVPQAACANQAFRTGPSAALPDCRAYEMVSPVDKGGGDIVASGGPDNGQEAAWRQSTPDGERLTYTSKTAFGDAARGAIANQYISTRAASGWSTHAITPAQGRTVFDPKFSEGFDLNTNFLAFTEDLCGALLVDQNLVPLTEDALPGHVNLYLRDNCGAGADGYEALTKELSFPAASSLELGLLYGSFSPKDGHVIFGSDAALTPEATESPNAKIYDATDGQLRLVSMLPAGAAAADSAGVGSAFVPNTGRQSPLSRAISEDGSRIFWTASSFGSRQVFVRIDGTRTVAVSAPASTVEFLSAAADGSLALYRQGETLYEFDVDAETKTAVAGELGGVVGSSQDLSYLYFTSRQALAAGAVAGEDNLYLRKGGTVSLIAVVSPADRGVGTAVGPNNPPTIDSRSPFTHSSRVSADGRHLVFMSNLSLTGYDNADANTGEAASEIYLYDADSAQISCVSCNPSGARPVGQRLRGAYLPSNPNGEGRTKLQAAAWLPTWEWSNHGKRLLSADGKRLLFNSFDGLVPEDKNDAQDVYQWEAPGTGSCRTESARYFKSNSGCITLISTGRSPEDSELLDASANGRDVFITTSSNIDPRDIAFIDIYDAREGGGFPPPPPPTPPCVGDACQSVPAPPSDQTPASAVFRGPGDAKAPGARQCRRGTRRVVRRSKAHCVPRHQHKRHKANRNRGAAR